MSSRVALNRMVAAALISQGKVLLARRAPDKQWYGNLWDLPGGHVEPGETERQAIVREVHEELGVIIREPVGPPVSKLSELAPSGIRLADLAVWIVRAWVGDIVNNSPREHRELRWFGPQELSALELAHPEYADILSKVIGRQEVR